MNLIKINTQEYPISIREFKSRFPTTAFPKQINYTEYGYAVVFPTPKPACTYKEIARELPPEMTVLDTWEQRWEVVDFTLDMDEDELEAFYAGLRAKKKIELATLRFEKETGGVTLPNGAEIDTERDSQAMITGAYTASIMNPDIVINWKGVNGWVQIGAAEITAIAQAVTAHVQACFTRESELSALIDIDPDTDITTGWPV